MKHLRVRNAPIVIAVVALGLVGAGIVVNSAISWLAKTSGHPSASGCIIKPAPVPIADSQPQLNFPIFSLTNDANAVLLSSQYAQGCDGAKGLELSYRINSDVVELVEASAPPAGSPLVVLKPGTPAHTGWTTATIDGHEIAMDVTGGGKGLPAGVVEAVWTNNETLFTLTPGNPTSADPPTPMRQQTLFEIVTNLRIA